MKLLASLGRRRFECPCTIEIENTPESLHAHVELDGDLWSSPATKCR